MKEHSKEIRQAREAKGLTQAALADLLHVGTSTVRAWENGRNIPSLAIRSRLEEILDISLQDLVPPPFQSSPQILGDENRQRMLKRVSSRWIKGVLENSLYLATLLVLGLREKPDAVENPWRLVVQESDLPERVLPAGTRLTDVYDEYDGKLLVLGEPGAGKTTLLLDLTKDLLERASNNEEHPMPVVFNLSSWAELQLPLAAWMETELNTKYQIPRQLANEWIVDQKILPLLDGLDEVLESQRTKCIDAINASLHEYGMLPMVVCSRNEEYLQQFRKLKMRTAVVVQPLTAGQISDYLSRAGRDLAAVRTALQQDEVLQEIASTPLMLSTLALTYRGQDISSLMTGSSIEERRNMILSNYVHRVLQRRGPVKDYSPEQTEAWLIWLAKNMERLGLTEFYIERMQPADWLPAERVRRYQNTVTRLVLGIEYLLAACLLPLFPAKTREALPGVLTLLGGGHGSALLGWMAPGIGANFGGVGSLLLIVAFVQVVITLIASRGGIPRFPKEVLGRAAMRALRNGAIVGVIVGGFAFLLLGRSGGVRAEGIGLYAGSLVIGMSLLVSLFNSGLPALRLSLKERLLDALLAWGTAIIGCGTMYMLQYELQYRAISIALVRDTLLAASFYSLIGLSGLGRAFHPGGIGSPIRPAEVVRWSGTWTAFSRHLKRGLVLGGILMASLMILVAGNSGIFYGIHYGLIYGLIYGAIVGLVAATAGVLAGFVTDGWSSGTLDDRHLTRPNEGIRRSLSNAILAAVLFGLLGGVISGVICALAFALAGISAWPILGLGLAIVLGSQFLLLFFLQQGGIAYAGHYILRWYLWRRGDLPWKYTKFLDYATERILLRRVGGGYIFIHRLLLEYFAHKKGQ